MMDTLINTIMKRKQELIGVIIQTQSFPARVVKYIAYLAWLVLVVNRVDSLLSFLSYIILLSRFMSATRRLMKDLKCLYIYTLVFPFLHRLATCRSAIFGLSPPDFFSACLIVSSLSLYISLSPLFSVYPCFQEP